MSKGQWHVRPNDIRRAIKSVQAEGLNITGVEIADSKIRVLTGKAVDNDNSDGDSLDRELAEFEARRNAS